MPANFNRGVAGLLACAYLMLHASGQIAYSTDFTDLSGWTTSSSTAGFEWNADATPSVSACSTPAFLSAPSSLNFNNGAIFGPPTGSSNGTATSPVIFLDRDRFAARATFWYSIDHERACAFDYTRFEVIHAVTGTILVQRCIPETSASASAFCTWNEVRVALDPDWGAVQLRFAAGSIDHLHNGGRGPFIDDLVVEYECDSDAEVVCPAAASSAYPGTLSTYAGARLEADGGASVSAGVFRVIARRIEGPGFALLLAGTGTPGVVWIGNGRLCIPPQMVQRLTLAPVDPSSDTARWTLPLGTPNSPLASVAPGDNLLLQVWYRDVTAGNFSDAVRVRFCQ